MSPAFQPYRRLRQASEHRLGRMIRLGVRKVQYFGRSKTLFQALIAAAIVNLTLIAGKTGQRKGGKSARRATPFLLSRCRSVNNSLFRHRTLGTDLSNLCGLVGPTEKAGSRPSFQALSLPARYQLHAPPCPAPRSWLSKPTIPRAVGRRERSYEARWALALGGEYPPGRGPAC
jgi:hypothetical protein